MHIVLNRAIFIYNIAFVRSKISLGYFLALKPTILQLISFETFIWPIYVSLLLGESYFVTLVERHKLHVLINMEQHLLLMLHTLQDMHALDGALCNIVCLI